MNAKITVIVPVYNGELHIKNCIENLLQQTYNNLEILIVNDGSKDKSAEIIAQYPVLCITHHDNKGLSAARNTGLDYATGEFIHFMDVDDSINNNYYQALYNAIIETNADIAASGMFNEAKPKRSKIFKKQKLFITVQDKLKATYVGVNGYVWRYLFRKDFLITHNLRFEEGRLIEDMMFSLPALYYAKSIVGVPGTEYRYREQENSIMTNTNIDHVNKRHQDWLYTKEQRKLFAQKHNIEIPGVTTGKWEYKWHKIVQMFNMKFYKKLIE